MPSRFFRSLKPIFASWIKTFSLWKIMIYSYKNIQLVENKNIQLVENKNIQLVENNDLFILEVVLSWPIHWQVSHPFCCTTLFRDPLTQKCGYLTLSEMAPLLTIVCLFQQDKSLLKLTSCNSSILPSLKCLHSCPCQPGGILTLHPVMVIMVMLTKKDLGYCDVPCNLGIINVGELTMVIIIKWQFQNYYLF